MERRLFTQRVPGLVQVFLVGIIIFSLCTRSSHADATAELDRLLTARALKAKRFWFSICPMYLTSSATSTDLTLGGRLTLVSKLYTGLDMRFLQRWDTSFATYAGIKINYIKYAPLLSAKATLDEDSNSLVSFELGAMVRPFARFSVDLSVGMQNDIFLFGSSTSSVTQSSLLIPTFGVSLGWDLVRTGGFGVSFSGFYAYKMGASGDHFTVNTGAAYGGRIAFRYFIEGDDRLEISLGGLQRSQGTSVTNQTETVLGLAGRIVVPLF